MSVQSEIDRINGAKSTLADNIEIAGFTAGEGASIVQLASTVGDAFTDTSSRLATVNGSGGTISTQLDTLDGTKTAIKDAIVDKGVDIPEGTVFRDYASKIGEIETGGGGIQSVEAPVLYGGKTSSFSFNFDVDPTKGIFVVPYEEKDSNYAFAISYSSDGGGFLASGGGGWSITLSRSGSSVTANGSYPMPYGSSTVNIIYCIF